MERKIGEIFKHQGEWYQCIENHSSCEGCDFKNTSKCSYAGTKCSFPVRQDCTSVIFKKLKKVGEPYTLENKKFQKYRVSHTPYIYNKIDCSWQSFADPYYVSLEIKPKKIWKKRN